MGLLKLSLLLVHLGLLDHHDEVVLDLEWLGLTSRVHPGVSFDLFDRGSLSGVVAEHFLQKILAVI